MGKGTAYGSEPWVVAHEGRCCRGEGTPPEASDAIRLDALAEQGGPAGALGLERCLQGVDGSKEGCPSPSPSLSPSPRRTYPYTALEVCQQTSVDRREAAEVLVHMQI